LTSLQAELLVAESQVSVAQADLEQARADLLAARTARQSAIAARDEAFAARDEALAERDQALAAAASAQAARDEAVAERDEALAERDEALSERDAAQSAAGAARAQVQQLQAAIDVLEREGATLEDEAERLREANRSLSAQNAALDEANDELAGRNEGLESLNATLEARIRDASARATELEQQVGDLTRRLEDQARRLAEVEREFDRAAMGDVTFETGELIYSGAIAAGDPAEARQALARFVRDASDATSRRGAGEVVLRSDQVAILVDAIVQTPGSDLVRLLSPRNQFSPVEVDVVVEAFENDLVLDAGRLLVTRRIHLGTEDLPISQAELRAALATMKADALSALRRAGLDEFQLPRYPTLSEETFAGLMLRRSGPVTVGVLVLDDVYRAGPADLELVLLD
jgi:hypothetical protein